MNALGTVMTPHEIEILLWYYARPDDHPDIQSKPPAWQKTIDKLFVDNLLDWTTDKSDIAYVINDKGRAYVQMLLNTPLPVCKWVAPDKEPKQ